MKMFFAVTSERRLGMLLFFEKSLLLNVIPKWRQGTCIVRFCPLTVVEFRIDCPYIKPSRHYLSLSEVLRSHQQNTCLGNPIERASCHRSACHVSHHEGSCSDFFPTACILKNARTPTFLQSSVSPVFLCRPFFLFGKPLSAFHHSLYSIPGAQCPVYCLFRKKVYPRTFLGTDVQPSRSLRSWCTAPAGLTGTYNIGENGYSRHGLFLCSLFLMFLFLIFSLSLCSFLIFKLFHLSQASPLLEPATCWETILFLFIVTRIV